MSASSSNERYYRDLLKNFSRVDSYEGEGSTRIMFIEFIDGYDVVKYQSIDHNTLIGMVREGVKSCQYDSLVKLLASIPSHMEKEKVFAICRIFIDTLRENKTGIESYLGSSGLNRKMFIFWLLKAMEKHSCKQLAELNVIISTVIPSKEDIESIKNNSSLQYSYIRCRLSDIMVNKKASSAESMGNGRLF